MFWKKKDDSEKKLVQMNQMLMKSFANVKKDTGNIFQWMNYFYKKSMEQDLIIRQLQTELSYMPKTREEIRRIIDDYYSFENLTTRIKEINEKVDWVARNVEAHKHDISEKILRMREAQQPQIFNSQLNQASQVSTLEPVIGLKENIESIRERLEKLEERKSTIKERIVKKITRNSKEYVKSVILSYIKRYERISALQLKDIIVDEQQFCSKSSFYRLLEELEGLEDVAVIKDGKEKHYFFKAKQSELR